MKKAKKQNKINNNEGRKITLAIIAMLLISGAIFGLVKACGVLRDIYLEQCVIVNVDEQVKLTAGKMVHPDTIKEALGIKVGANLALIDFKTRRLELLKKAPNLRNIFITRHLPDKVTIETEERVPMARINLKGRKSPSGLVVDSDGVVFSWARGTGMLPMIRESETPLSSPGQVLTGKALAALRVIEACQDSDLHDLGILEIDISKPDYLIATLTSYSTAKIAWDSMTDVDSFESRRSMLKQLTLLSQAISSRVGDDTMNWNATDTSGRIYAEMKGGL